MGLIVTGRTRFTGKFEGVFPQLPPPTPSFTASSTTGLVPFTVQFTNTTTGTNVSVSYEWDFNGDGTVDSTDVNPSYTYANTGTYSVSLTVVNTGGRITTTATNYIIAYSIPPTSLSGTSVNSIGLRMAVYDVNSLIGTINSLPLNMNSDTSSAQTIMGTSIVNVPIAMTNY